MAKDNAAVTLGRARQGHSSGNIHKAAKDLGHKGGLKGGNARADALTGNQRSAIASKGGKAKANKQ